MDEELEITEFAIQNGENPSSPNNLITRGGCTYTHGFSSYLQSQNRVDRSAPHSKYLRGHTFEQQSDWEHLRGALEDSSTPRSQALRRFFSSTVHYRMRFEEHFSSGKDFVAQVFAHDGHFFQQLPHHAMARYREAFEQLCERAAMTEKPRLFELTSSLDSTPVTINHFLAILFACGYGDSIEPHSLSYFVARFQFFEKFLNGGNRLHGLIQQKEIVSDVLRWLFKSANALWFTSCAAARKLTGGITSPKELFEIADRSQEVTTIQRWLSHNQPGFSTSHDAVVHLFRHVDEIYAFHGFNKRERKEWAAGIYPESAEANRFPTEELTRSINFLTQDYYTMIATILNSATQIEPQHSQFGGHKFSFSTRTGKHRVIASILPDRISLILTCF